MNDRYDPKIHHRRSIRLRGYDYDQAGAYFVTITAQGRACLFGEVVGEQMRLNEAGGMLQEVWRGLSQRFPDVEVGSFVVMPNHVHGIIALHEPVGAPLVGAQCEAIGAIGDDRTTGDDMAIRDNEPIGNNRATTRVAPTLGGGRPFVAGCGNATTTNTLCGSTDRGVESVLHRSKNSS